MTRRPRPALNPLNASNNEPGPRLPNEKRFQDGLFPLEDPDEFSARFWGNAKPPSQDELAWIRAFGAYPGFDPSMGKLSSRLSLEVADLRQATRIIVYYHYLHRARTMAQLPYWILMDKTPVGVLLFSLPRLSVPLDGIPPMNVLELARMWASPDVQGGNLRDSRGRIHAVSVASCVVGKALKRVRQDWYRKYAHMPDIYAVVSWADTVHHEGTIYRAANFIEMGSSGKSMHGNRRRPNGGRDQHNLDYAHEKTRFLYRFRKPLTHRQKERLAGVRVQPRLFSD